MLRPACRRRIDLTVYNGEFYALVGPNGAGKTTTLRMVAGLLRPDAGSITIEGIDSQSDPIAAKQITAWLSDEPMIYDRLTPFEDLRIRGWALAYRQVVAEARARELIDWLGLASHAHDTLRRISPRHEAESGACRRASTRSTTDYSR